MIEFSWQKHLHSGDRRDRRFGCTSRIKVYNKTAESVLSRGSHDKFGTGMYNYMYHSDKQKVLQFQEHGCTRVEITYYLHTGQESDDFIAPGVAAYHQS